METLAVRLELWLASQRRSLKLSTWLDYQSAIRSRITPGLGHLPLDQVTPRVVREWVAGLPCGNKRVNNLLIPLRSVLREAFLDEEIEKDLAGRIRNLKVVKEEPDPLSPVELRRVIEAAAWESRLQAWVQFAAWSGLRTGEQIALLWEDVDFNAGCVWIRRSRTRGETADPKTAAGQRRLALLSPAREALKLIEPFTRLLRREVFHDPKTGQPWASDAPIRRAWRQTLKNAGVRYRSPYHTRHTFASMLLSAGESPMWVAHQMGHTDWGMIRMRYGRWLPDSDPEAGQRATKLWNSMATRKSSVGR
ncbi:MAG: site-specific integrase [Magnetococcales bacterium]|nr:site-specific integrase [Magnetococcales bacterium]